MKLKKKYLGNVEYALFLILTFSTLTSCGGPVKDNSKSFSKPYYANEIMEMKKVKTNCNSFQSHDFQALSFDIIQFLAGQEILSTIDFRDQINSSFMLADQEGVISKSAYGMEDFVSVEYKWGENGYFIAKDSVAEHYEAAQSLMVCPSRDALDSYTIEAAGLSVSNNIHRTNKAVLLAMPSLYLPEVSLNITPTVRIKRKFKGGELDYTQQYVYSADNASFNPGTKVITFQPQSKDAYESGQKPYWELPMVASHEYGHHIFNELFFKHHKEDSVYSNDKPNKELIHGCFNNHKHFKAVQFSTSSESERSGDAQFALDSMNEGFSDLIALYTSVDGTENLSGIECFSKTRDALSAKTNDYGRKKFTDEGLSLMDSPSYQELSANRTCDTINFQGIHSVGSIFAYQINQFYSKLTQDKATKLKFLLKWAAKLKEEHTRIKSLKASQYIFQAIELAIKVALDEQGADPATYNCKELDKAFTFDDSSTDAMKSLKYQCIYLVEDAL